MNTVARIMKELNNNNRTQKDLADHLHIKKTVITDWKSGKSKSYLAHIKEIADFLNVSTDYLLNGGSPDSEFANTGTPVNPSPRRLHVDLSEFDCTSIELMKTFNTLSLKDKARVINYMLELKNEVMDNEN